MISMTSSRAGQRYRIVLKGGRHVAWEDYMEDVTVRVAGVMGQRRTIIEGRLVDESALFGLVATACDLGLVLVSIEPLEGTCQRAEEE